VALVATKVKFCGITSLADAELCASHEPWALGLIFVPRSPRRCKQSEAARIVAAMRRRVELAGVFENAALDHVSRTVEALELTLVQLHGDEGPSYCAEVARRTGARIIKAARVRTRPDVVALGAFHTDFHMLDGPGGGRPFDWALVRERRGAKADLIVAGGLTHENVGDAIAVTRPFAVDVASGNEASPGVKDPAKVAAFAEAVAAAEIAA
jgi:phosphoribosylanthranilate isomerase